jgi:hypothetical protein
MCKSPLSEEDLKEGTLGDEVFVIFGILPGIGMILSSFLLFAYQIFLWLLEGVWTEYDLLKLAKSFSITDSLPWLMQPKSWLGVHKVFLYFLEFPLSLGLIVGGVIWIIFIAELIEGLLGPWLAFWFWR